MELEKTIEKIKNLSKLKSDLINEIGSELYLQRVKLIHHEVNDLKNQRNFTKLIPLYEKQLTFCSDSIEDFVNKTTEIAYCLARTNQFDKAEELTKEIALFANLYPDKIFQITLLLTHFVNPDNEEFLEITKDTIKAWLNDPKSSEQIELVIFDYKDFVGNIEPFDKSRLKKFQTYFPQNLIDDIFNVMTTDLTEEKYYYNRETNNIQQFAYGYFSNYPFNDEERERYLKRITSDDNKDVIVEGLHFQIPFLSLVDFIGALEQNCKEYKDLMDFIIHFEKKLLEKYKDKIDSLDDFNFQKRCQNILLEELEIYSKEKNIDLEKSHEIIRSTKQFIGLDFLKNANMENEYY